MHAAFDCVDLIAEYIHAILPTCNFCHHCCVDQRLMCTQFCQWVYDWHIHRFGLTNLAEINLADLIKSVQVCWKQSTKVTHFGQLTAIIQSRNLPRW